MAAGILHNAYCAARQRERWAGCAGHRPSDSLNIAHNIGHYVTCPLSSPLRGWGGKRLTVWQRHSVGEADQRAALASLVLHFSQSLTPVLLAVPQM